MLQPTHNDDHLVEKQSVVVIPVNTEAGCSGSKDKASVAMENSHMDAVGTTTQNVSQSLEPTNLDLNLDSSSSSNKESVAVETTIQNNDSVQKI
ncbi:hypothetical protein ACH5RR_029499 [Cinchona calisaya]|uniref:Uncharacterized protein n=1 Tax=Cinchona calisaya TaxID=153742 RepID=A0ABD2YT14_9GENT